MTKTCIIYCRVSTQKQGRHGESVETQERNCRLFAQRNGYGIEKVFVDNYSGRKLNRPAFNELRQYVADHSHQLSYIIFSDIDRLTREGSSAYERFKEEVRQHGVDLIDIFGLIQPPVNTLAHTGFEYEWSVMHPTAIAEKLKADVAQDEVRRILTRTIGASIEYTKKGYWLRQPPEGYLNKKVYIDGKRRSILVPDPERAKYIRLMFQMRASGKYTDKQICERLNAMGYRSRTQNKWDRKHARVIGKSGGRPLTPRQLQRFIRRPIFAGVICEKWSGNAPVPAKFNGLVDLNTFNSANEGELFIKRMLDGSLEFVDVKKTIHASVATRTAIPNSRTNPSCVAPNAAGRSREVFPRESAGCAIPFTIAVEVIAILV